MKAIRARRRTPRATPTPIPADAPAERLEEEEVADGEVEAGRRVLVERVEEGIFCDGCDDVTEVLCCEDAAEDVADATAVGFVSQGCVAWGLTRNVGDMLGIYVPLLEKPVALTAALQVVATPSVDIMLKWPLLNRFEVVSGSWNNMWHAYMVEACQLRPIDSSIGARYAVPLAGTIWYS